MLTQELLWIIGYFHYWPQCRRYTCIFTLLPSSLESKFLHMCVRLCAMKTLPYISNCSCPRSFHTSDCKGHLVDTRSHPADKLFRRNLLDSNICDFDIHHRFYTPECTSYLDMFCRLVLAVNLVDKYTCTRRMCSGTGVGIAVLHTLNIRLHQFGSIVLRNRWYIYTVHVHTRRC